ncbi:MAG: glycosyltransferase family 2 protein [Butyrivibrio sp.]
MNKLVSVCIPAYNGEKYISKTIQSILNQSYSNIEVVVVDDHSSDNTVEVVRAIKDTRVRLICNEENLGMTGNWNKCIRESKGEYVKLIPGDDFIYEECIEKSIKILEENPRVKLVVAGCDLVDNDNKVIGAYAHWPKEGIFSGHKIAKKSVMLNNFFGNPVCAMFRREDFERTGGFDPVIPYILDFDLWLSLSSLGDVAVIKEKLSAFRVRRDSNTGVLTGSRGKEYTAEHVRLLDKHIKLGTYRMNRFERRLSIIWRALRNHIIAAYIRIKS